MNKDGITPQNLEKVMNGLVAKAAEEWEVDKELILRKTRKREAVDVRKAIYKVVHKNKTGKVSLQSIADYFNQSHCAVIRNVEEAEKLMDQDRRFRVLICTLDSHLESIIFDTCNFYEISGIVPGVNRMAFFGF